MAHDDLRDFIRALEKNNELKRIPFEVDTRLEITEFADRSVKTGGPALLFEKPRLANGSISRIPVLINSFASMRRMEIALEVNSVDEVAKRISEYLEMRMPEGLLGKLKMLPKLAEMGAFFPKIVSKGACQEVVRTENFSLYDYPVLTCWPGDGGPFITLPMVFSKNPETGKRNCGMYRLQVFDERTTGMHWQTHKQGAEHYRRNVAEGKITRMDVAVAIGADPATMYSAILPLPPDLDEMMIAGFLRGSPVEMVKCQTVDLEVPANSELSAGRLCGTGRAANGGAVWRSHRLLLARRRVSGLPRYVRHRAPRSYLRYDDRGPPPMEDFYMGKAIERIFLPLMRMQIPGSPRHVHAGGRRLPQPDAALHPEVVSRPRAQSHERNLGSRSGHVHEKIIVVVDEDVDVQNYSEVAWRALNNIDPERDIQFTMGPIDSLDHASRLVNYGSKMGIDATRKWPGEGFTREWPEVLTMPADVKARVGDMWKKLGL